MTNTSNLGITLLEASQAQKEVTINEAFVCLDAMVLRSIIDKDLATPPSSPAAGDLYIVASSPTGAWTGHAKAIAYFSQIWRFVTPIVGMRVWVNDESTNYKFDGTAWVISTSGSASWSPDGSDILAASSPVIDGHTGQILKSYNTGGTQKLNVAQVVSGDYLQIGQAASALSGIKFQSGSGGLALQMEGTSAECSFSNRLGIGSGASGGTAKLTVYGASGEGTNGQTVRVGQSASIDFSIRRNTTSGTLEFEGTQTGSRGFKFMSGAVAIGAADANAAALLDLQSTSQGVLLPRMTTSQKTAISTPPEGLSVYDTTLHSLSIYDGSAWGQPGIDASAWTSYTPTVTAQSGTFSSISATGAYKQIGKTVFVRMTITITTVGTAANMIYATLPVTAQGAGYVLSGRENGTTGKMVQGWTAAASTTLNILYYDNSSPITAGASIILSGTYQAS